MPELKAPKVETWKVSQLKPYKRNARKHGKKQIEQLRASLRQFGWTMPLLVRKDGTLIAGHGRLEAAKAEGFKEAPVIVAIGWTEAQCRAYTLADNKLGELSSWDKTLLGGELQALGDLGVSLEEFGFDGPDANEAAAAAGAAPQLGGDLSYSVVIRCKDEAHQTELLAKFEQQGLTCEALIS